MFGKPRITPTSDEPEPEPPSNDGEEHLRVLDWRRYHFEQDCNLPYPLALNLALAGADWHAVERAIGDGMTVEQVERVFL